MITVNAAVESKRFRYHPSREWSWYEDMDHPFSQWHIVKSIDEDEEVPPQSPTFDPEPPVHTD